MFFGLRLEPAGHATAVGCIRSRVRSLFVTHVEILKVVELAIEISLVEPLRVGNRSNGLLITMFICVASVSASVGTSFRRMLFQ